MALWIVKDRRLETMATDAKKSLVGDKKLFDALLKRMVLGKPSKK